MTFADAYFYTGLGSVDIGVRDAWQATAAGGASDVDSDERVHDDDDEEDEGR